MACWSEWLVGWFGGRLLFELIIQLHVIGTFDAQIHNQKKLTSMLPATSPKSRRPSSITRRAGASTSAFHCAPGRIAASAAACVRRVTS
jgi:hypothetical protein